MTDEERRRKAQKAKKYYFVSKFKINYLFKFIYRILSISQEIQEKEGSMIE